MKSLGSPFLRRIEANLFRIMSTPLVLVACSLCALAAGGRAIALGASAQSSMSVSPSGDEADERRHQELVGRRADVTVLRLNEIGEAVARLDLHFGRALPANEVQLFAILNQFEIDGEQQLDASRGTQREELSWRNIVLPSPSAPEGLPDMEFFDPEADMAIEFRRVDGPTSLTCSASTAINFTAIGSSGKNYYWYPSSDAIAVVAGPGVQSGANPDLYLALWNGSNYVTVASSTGPGGNAITSWNTACQSKKRRVRTYLSNGGAFFTWATKINAN